ncbi:hypothetical protein B0T10DRAFT_414109, partial [Thelonectria olida]
LLIEKGIDTTVATKDGSTPLHAVSQNGHVKVVRQLLTTPGVETSRAGNHGRTALFFASRCGYNNAVQDIRVLQLLVQHAKRAGSPIPNDPAPVNATLIPFDHESDWCDACTLSIREGCGYSCRVCDSGGFYLCVE